MARTEQRFKTKCSIKLPDGTKIPWYEIDEDGKVTEFLSEEEAKKHKGRMMNNTGEVMSRYLYNHPEAELWENYHLYQ